MKAYPPRSSFWALAAVLSVACSSAGGHRSGLSDSSGGSSAQGGGGGTIPVSGGSSAGGSGATGGTGIIVAGSSGTAGSAGMAPVCNSLTATSTRLVPTVLILVDNSSSMFEPSQGSDGQQDQTPWTLLYDALMDPMRGVVKPLENDLRFGFTSYQGNAVASSEDSPSCATLTPASPTFAFGNYDAINQVYTQLGTEWTGQKWETPTGFAVASVTPDLVNFEADPPGPKYILLVTDGNPNTCATLDPQCGQDRTIAAVQAAYAQGVGTFVIGIGDIVAQPNDGCNVTQARCGSDHLQDVANAGAGLPVEAPPADYVYQPCVQNEGQSLTATYAADGETPGTAPYFATNDGDALREHLSDLLNSVTTCTFDLDAIVTGDPTHSLVTLNGNPLTYGDTADGWMLEDNRYQVTLTGGACDTYRAGDANEVNIEFFCDEMGNPIAEPR